MRLTDIPASIAIPFGNSAASGYLRPIPVPSQIGITPGAASFTDGFPPSTFTPLSGGGVYVSGADVNGVLNHVTQWTRWVAAGGSTPFNAAFATSIGGYPNLAIVPSVSTPGRAWLNSVDGNMTDPDGASPVGWVSIGPVAATLSQALAGTDNTTFITPNVLNALGNSVGDTQSFYLPGGGILKCVNNVNINTGANITTTPITFANPFPKAFYGAWAEPTNQANPSWGPLVTRCVGFTKTGGTLWCDTGNPAQSITYNSPVVVFALGR